MSGRNSAATDRAVRLVLAGRMSRYAAARRCKVAPSTVYRALARLEQRPLTAPKD